MNSWLIIAVKVEGNVLEALSNAGKIIDLLPGEVTVLNTIPAPAQGTHAGVGLGGLLV